MWLGSRRYIEERGIGSAEVLQRADALSSAGRTIVAIGDGREVWGLVAVADGVRPEAKDIVAALHAAGIKHVVMLTGDNRATANAIAQQTGIDEVRAELLPGNKVAAVEDLVRRHGSVAMVGDGVNDAPAMGRANLGIAMGAMGSDAAIETADVALMSDDLSKLPWLVRHSRATLSVIRQNVAFSIAVKLLFTALTVIGLASLWGAIAADVGASLLVVLNGLRLRSTRRSLRRPWSYDASASRFNYDPAGSSVSRSHCWHDRDPKRADSQRTVKITRTDRSWCTRFCFDARHWRAARSPLRLSSTSPRNG